MYNPNGLLTTTNLVDKIFSALFVPQNVTSGGTNPKLLCSIRSQHCRVPQNAPPPVIAMVTWVLPKIILATLPHIGVVWLRACYSSCINTSTVIIHNVHKFHNATSLYFLKPKLDTSSRCLGTFTLLWNSSITEHIPASLLCSGHDTAAEWIGIVGFKVEWQTAAGCCHITSQ